MDKRDIIAIVLSSGILAAWSKLFSPKSAPPVQAAPAPARPRRRRLRNARRRPRRAPPHARRGRRRGGRGAIESARAAGRARRRPRCGSSCRTAAGRSCTPCCARSSSSTATAIRRAATTWCGPTTRKERPAHDVSRLLLPDAPRRRLGGDPAGPRQGRVLHRLRQCPHREALPGGHDALPAAAGRRRLQPGRQAGGDDFVLAVSGRQDPDKRGGGFFSGPVGQRLVGDLHRQR